MKLNGIIGKGTGKLGSSVFAIIGGVQIMREYNPEVSNPNTVAQIAQRAKLKLMSQLAAALAPALLFVKQGLVSARNQFVSKNIGFASYQNDTASIALNDLQLTPSSVAFPGVGAVSGGAGTLAVSLDGAAAADIKRVAYYVFKEVDDNQLQYVQSTIVTEAGVNRTFPHEFTIANGSYVVYAYGIKDNNTSATMKYENYAAEVEDAEATLAVEAIFRSAAYLPTRTSGVIVEVQ